MPGKYYRLRRPAVIARFKYSGQDSQGRVDGETIVVAEVLLERAVETEPGLTQN